MANCPQLPHHVGERCGFIRRHDIPCGEGARHKVGSEDPTKFHNLTQYLCCYHYAMVMGPAVPCAWKDKS